MRHVTLKTKGQSSESKVPNLLQEGKDAASSSGAFTATTLHLSWYELPFSDPPRLLVKLEGSCHEATAAAAAAEGHREPAAPPSSSLSKVRSSWELSVNLPAMPAPPRHHFYAKTWGENEGLLDQLVGQGW